MWAWDWGRWLRDGRAPLGQPLGPRAGVLCWDAGRAAGSAAEAGGPGPGAPPGQAHLCGAFPRTPGPSGLGSVWGEAGACRETLEGSSESTLCLSLLTPFCSVVLPTPQGGHIGRGGHLGLRRPPSLSEEGRV